jgi:hypothetical protein
LITFVDPMSGLAAPTSAVGADIIFRDTGKVARLEVFDASGASLGSLSTPPDTGFRDEVFVGFEDPVIFSATFVFDPSESIVGIDNLILSLSTNKPSQSTSTSSPAATLTPSIYPPTESSRRRSSARKTST